MPVFSFNIDPWMYFPTTAECARHRVMGLVGTRYSAPQIDVCKIEMLVTNTSKNTHCGLCVCHIVRNWKTISNQSMDTGFFLTLLFITFLCNNKIIVIILAIHKFFSGNKWKWTNQEGRKLYVNQGHGIYTSTAGVRWDSVLVEFLIILPLWGQQSALVHKAFGCGANIAYGSRFLSQLFHF